MEKKIEDYLPYYIGQEMIEPTIGEVFGIIEGFCSKENSVLLSGVWYPADIIGIKLRLRPMSDMKIGERAELWRIVFKRTFPITGDTRWIGEVSLTGGPRWVMSSGVERLGIETTGDVWADSDLHRWKFIQGEVFHYLLKQGFDLFDLIPEGLAVDKTKEV